MPDTLSATVLLRPAGGGTHENVTVETVERSLPDPEAQRRAVEYFRDAGFEVTAAYGPSFSIVGERDLFERAFGTRIETQDDQGVLTSEGTLELPLERVDPEVARSLQAVTFTPPPAFGPTDFA